jgi:hypothetical protein
VTTYLAFPMRPTMTILACLLAAVACTPSNTDTQTAAGSATAVSGQSVSATPALAVAAPDTATGPAPDVLLRQLYKLHDAQRGPLFQTKSRALVDRFFAKKLADLIWQDAKHPKDEAGAIDADPLYNTQDAQITDFAIAAPMLSANNQQATVRVTFLNDKTPYTVIFSLKREQHMWKIDEITYGSDVVEQDFSSWFANS